MTERNPFQTVLEIAGGYPRPRCLHVVADLGVADALDENPASGQRGRRRTGTKGRRRAS